MIELIIIAVALNYEILLDNNVILLNIMNWPLLNIEWNLVFDSITSIMTLMILSISIIVILYTYDYMIADAHINRFYLYIVLFIVNMLLLITASNIIILFIFWEGVGLTSFLLISYWFTRLETSLGALLALFLNRIGDVLLIVGILYANLLIKSNDIVIMNSVVDTNLDILLFFFLLAAMAKSAQLYIHIWLPYSMEGPTPISALIHAATMVTAGVYLLIRLQNLISLSYYILILIGFIGLFTAFIGSLLAIVSLDLKELIAYSTMSQLGYMVTCLGLKLNNLSFYHLIFHAYFKALLFLTIGSIIHTILDIQDIRLTGGLFSFIPLSYIWLLYGFTSLMGVPFTTGYYSKESIIMMSLNYSYNSYWDLFLSQYIFILTLITAFLTIFYSMKFIFHLYFNITRLSIFILSHIHFYSLYIIISLSILSLMTLIVGYILNKWNILLDMNIPFLNHNIEVIIKLIPVSFFIIVFMILNRPIYSNIDWDILKLQFGFKELYIFLAAPIVNLSYRILFKILDYGYIDLLFPITSIYLYNISQYFSIFINYQYILSFILSSLFMLLYIF
jgi:NADH-ubiquinone oxidoreductase chain 5